MLTFSQVEQLIWMRVTQRSHLDSAVLVLYNPTHTIRLRHDLSSTLDLNLSDRHTTYLAT